jgi:hypothetical protein
MTSALAMMITTTPCPAGWRQMQGGATAVLKAVEKLGVLANTGGTDVFGSYDAVNDIKHQLQTARDLLSQLGPKQPVIFDDEDDEESSDLEEADA